MRLTKEQNTALKAKYNKSAMRRYLTPPPSHDKGTYILVAEHYKSFLSFRRSVVGTFGCDGAVSVMWCGMWLCIEKDGYTHS